MDADHGYRRPSAALRHPRPILFTDVRPGEDERGAGGRAGRASRKLGSRYRWSSPARAAMNLRLLVTGASWPRRRPPNDQRTGGAWSIGIGETAAVTDRRPSPFSLNVPLEAVQAAAPLAAAGVVGE